MSHESDSDLSRRTFLKASGLVAGAAIVGPAGDALADHSTFDHDFANWRAREAKKVWDRGYRGRPDRTIAFTDSGMDARHPDIGPWNGIRAIREQGDLLLTKPEENVYPERDRTGDIAGGSFSGQLGPGGPGSSEAPSDRATHEFTVPTADDSGELSEDVDEVDATLTWTPQRQDNELFFEAFVDGQWQRRASSTNFNPQSGAGESLTAPVEPGRKYRFVVETYANATMTYELDYSYARFEVLSEGDIDTSYTKADVFADVPDDPSKVDHTTPKVLGWYNESGGLDSRRPRDSGTHGTNGASVAAGTGRAISVDTDRLTVEEPRAELLPTDVVEYTVTARTETSVFASVYGDALEVEIEGPDGRSLVVSDLGNDASFTDNVTTDTPTVHERGTATYTVYVRPASGGAGRLDRVAVGASLREAESDGDRSGPAQTIHAGVAPNAGLFGMQGLGGATTDLGDNADEFADLFNIRAVNMSWSYVAPVPVVGGLFTPPFGAAGAGVVSTNADVRKITEGGILTVAAASNSFTPGQTSAPGLSEESISVVATDPLDGIVSYSSAGMAASDEDDGHVYTKPDVTAPSGSLDAYPAGDGSNLVRAAEAGDPNASEDEQGPVRDYYWTAGTSFSSPFVAGVAGLVSEAMEFDAPDSIALPEPKDTTKADVMRLKQAILATATETPFTAAPYHNRTYAKGPTYDFGDRDLYEGFGRVNPEVAVDAVARDLLPDLPSPAEIPPEESASATYEETVGLNLPEDQRAVGGYVDVRGGTLEVNVDFAYYSGGNEGMTQGNPHVDLFVYDAENPATDGTPNVVASAQGLEGAPSVSVDVDRRSSPDAEFNTRTFYVVAKLVNVPGVVNGYDVQAHLDLGLSYEAASAVPKPAFSAGGSRSDDGSVFTAGQSNQVDVTLETVPGALPDEAIIRIEDRSPWDVDVGFRDAEAYQNGVVVLGTTTAKAVRESDEGVTKTYFAEAPGSTGQDTFGPARAVVETDVSDTFSARTAEFGGTETNTVVGADTDV